MRLFRSHQIHRPAAKAPAATKPVPRSPAAGAKPGERRSPNLAVSVKPTGSVPAEHDYLGTDESDESDMRGPRRFARLRERARIKAILLHPAAKANFELAKMLAFKSDLTRSAACKILDSAPRLGGTKHAQDAIDATWGEVTSKMRWLQ